jgi:hypothetical protein
MQQFTFDSAAAADNVIAQLPLNAIGPNSGIASEPQSDGRYILSVPDALAAQVAAIDPTTPGKSGLAAYANAKQWDKAVGGCTLRIAGTPHVFATDATSMALITGKAVRLQQPNAPGSVEWQFPDGFVTIATDEFMTAATAVADFVQGTFDTLKTVLDGISAGTVTTTAAIDTAFA